MAVVLGFDGEHSQKCWLQFTPVSLDHDFLLLFVSGCKHTVTLAYSCFNGANHDVNRMLGLHSETSQR